MPRGAECGDQPAAEPTTYCDLTAAPFTLLRLRLVGTGHRMMPSPQCCTRSLEMPYRAISLSERDTCVRGLRARGLSYCVDPTLPRPAPVSSSPQTCSETYAKSPRPAALNWNAAHLIEFSHHHRALVDPFELNTVAWNYRERTGEIDDAPLASRFLAAPSNKWSGAASDAGCSFRIRLLPLQKGLQNGLNWPLRPSSARLPAVWEQGPRFLVRNCPAGAAADRSRF